MKETELRETLKCVACERPILHTGMPFFWRVTAERFGVDLRVLQRQANLARAVGSRQLATIIGPDDDVAKSMQGPVKFAICDQCASADTPPIMVMIERQVPSQEDPPEAIPS